jgi:hypothetical protein
MLIEVVGGVDEEQQQGAVPYLRRGLAPWLRYPRPSTACPSHGECACARAARRHHVGLGELRQILASLVSRIGRNPDRP